MKANVDAGKCEGTGVCEQVCPEVFEVQKGLAKVKGDSVPTDSEDSCRRARDNCPTDAISIQE